MRYFLSVLLSVSFLIVSGQSVQKNVWQVFRTNDFSITGMGSSAEWAKAPWLQLLPNKVTGDTLQTKVKTLYSETGLYFLFECEDRKLTSTMKADFLDLWKEDVVEVFVHTDTTTPAYFEYELSPHNYELPILISNVNKELRRWMPFHYEANRKTHHKTNIIRKGANSKDLVKSWTAEFFIPYTLLSPLKNNIPSPGTRWKANYYRVDYDNPQYTFWWWQPTRENFHDMERFGILEFQ